MTADDKIWILQNVVEELEREFETLAKAAREARDAATSEESKSENKYDTRGLEASYLAGAQAKRASEIGKTIESLKKLELRSFQEGEPVQATALVETLLDGEETKWFFMVPQQGGMKVSKGTDTVFTVSPQSPFGERLFGRTCGDVFELAVRGQVKEYEIVSVL